METIPVLHCDKPVILFLYKAKRLSIKYFLSYLNCLVSSSPLVTGFKAGKSVEGRDIMALKISTGGSKPAIFIGKSVKILFLNFNLIFQTEVFTLGNGSRLPQLPALFRAWCKILTGCFVQSAEEKGLMEMFYFLVSRLFSTSTISTSCL